MASAKLIIRSPRLREQEVRLAGGASIGRALDNSVRVDVEGVSRYHAIIEQRDDGFWLSDLGSRNGTKLNGVIISGDRKLGDGDSVVLGAIATLQFHLESGTMAENGSGAPAPTASESANPAGPNRQPFSSGKRALLTGLGIVFIVVGIFVVAQLVSSRSRVDTASPEATTKSDGSARATGDAGKQDRETGGNAAEAVPAVASGEKEAPLTEGLDPLASRTAQECQKLAGLIVNKNGSGYVFDAAFVAQVLGHIDEHRVDMRDHVRTHRFQVNKAFGAVPLHKVTGYLLAISRSKFRDDAGASGGTGLWRVPKSIAVGYKSENEPESIVTQPDRSVDIAAQYFKSLVNVFGPDDFMYAIACFGMPISAAGEMRNELDKAGPIARRNFWEMAKKGVVPRDGVDRVVRFFAAGIAAENPDGGGQPLSWLISN
jgi:hypothetical protein